MNLLEIRDLVVLRGHGVVLEGVDLDVADGEVAGVLGTNGVGKTTLLETIAGLHRPTRGTIRFQGEEIGAAGPKAVARAGIRLVPEGRRLFDRLTVAENLRIGAEAAGHSDWRWILDIFPRLQERIHHNGGALSGGEQQMVAIGRALVGRPQLILLDEPSWGLAPLLMQGVLETIREINERGTTVVLVEQNVDAAIEVAGRLLILAGGRIARVLDHEQAIAHPEVIEQAYLTGA